MRKTEEALAMPRSLHNSLEGWSRRWTSGTNEQNIPRRTQRRRADESPRPRRKRARDRANTRRPITTIAYVAISLFLLACVTGHGPKIFFQDVSKGSIRVNTPATEDNAINGTSSELSGAENETMPSTITNESDNSSVIQSHVEHQGSPRMHDAGNSNINSYGHGTAMAEQVIHHPPTVDSIEHPHVHRSWDNRHGSHEIDSGQDNIHRNQRDIAEGAVDGNPDRGHDPQDTVNDGAEDDDNDDNDPDVRTQGQLGDANPHSGATESLAGHSHGHEPDTGHLQADRIANNRIESDRGTASLSSMSGADRQAAGNSFGQRCFYSHSSSNALCIHKPLCIRYTGVVRISDAGGLSCEPYTNRDGTQESLSNERCTEVERDVASRAGLAYSERKSWTWLSGLDRDGRVQWYEGDTVFLQLSDAGRAIAHYAQRIMFIHHILQNAERYGTGPGGFANVIILAAPAVARKIKFRRSWHHWLLMSVVHPSVPVYSHAEAAAALTARKAAAAAGGAPGPPLVYVAGGAEDAARGHSVPCLRRATVPGSLRGGYLLDESEYPGLLSQPSLTAAAGGRPDARSFRVKLFAALGRGAVPKPARRLVYLHREGGRALEAHGRRVLEDALTSAATSMGWTYESVDTGQLGFVDTVGRVGDAGVAVGVHGTQLAATMAMGADAGAGLVEVFPYRFAHGAYRDGCGAGLFYRGLSVARGDDYAGLSGFSSVEDCIAQSRECRLWYRSDERALVFDDADASAVRAHVLAAMAHADRAAGRATDMAAAAMAGGGAPSAFGSSGDSASAHRSQHERQTTDTFR